MLRMVFDLIVDLIIVGLLICFGFVVIPLASPVAPLYAKLILVVYFAAIIWAVIYRARNNKQSKA